MSKHIVLIRHGQSEGQLHSGKARRDADLLDCYLTKKGERQAREVPDLLKDQNHGADFDLICTSPLTRAIATCVLAFGNLHEQVPIFCHPDLAEIGSGIPENQARMAKEVVRDLTKRFRHNPVAISATRSIDFSMLPQNWPESAMTAGSGSGPFLDWLQTRPERRIAVVCHHNVIIHRLLDRSMVVRVPNCVPIPCILPDCDGTEVTSRLQPAAAFGSRAGMHAATDEKATSTITLGLVKTKKEKKEISFIEVRPVAKDLILAASQNLKVELGLSAKKKDKSSKKSAGKQSKYAASLDFLLYRISDGKQ
eukprot:CAMPEP_0113576536 /NCGR_PEP_ID=MMETSP0015_2-20120614/28351_1 /TAXON_ID=2838 /ORGANISM="Odontella" /LENGTH=308 /DNA_ID=CAMNT_0000479983 /DNA_START=215 /DNA_END=1138 /DNA_ORIENTATION=- /assembly_acc=CAM_ASM_000160